MTQSARVPLTCAYDAEDPATLRRTVTGRDQFPEAINRVDQLSRRRARHHNPWRTTCLVRDRGCSRRAWCRREIISGSIGLFTSLVLLPRSSMHNWPPLFSARGCDIRPCCRARRLRRQARILRLLFLTLSRHLFSRPWFSLLVAIFAGVVPALVHAGHEPAGITIALKFCVLVVWAVVLPSASVVPADHPDDNTVFGGTTA